MFSLDFLFVTYKHTDASDDRHTLMRRADVGTDRLSQQIVPLRGCRGVWGRGLRRTALYQFHYCGFSHSLLNKQHTSDVVSVCMLFCRRTINDQIPWVPVECSWTESKSHHRKQIYALIVFVLFYYLCWQSFMLFIYFLLYFYFSIQCNFSFFYIIIIIFLVLILFNYFSYVYNYRFYFIVFYLLYLQLIILLNFILFLFLCPGLFNCILLCCPSYVYILLNLYYIAVSIFTIIYNNIFHFFILFSYPSYIYNYIHFIFAVLALLFTMLCFSWFILFDYIFFNNQFY